MEITHTWKIKRLIQKNDESGLIIQVYFKLYSTDDEYSYASAGNVELDINNIKNFVSYESLTEEVVIEWVKNKLGMNCQNYEQTNIDWITSVKNKIAPAIKIQELPWLLE